MHEYDVALKLLLQSSADTVLQQVTRGIRISRWLNPEMPQVQTSRVDLLGAAGENSLVHIEFQSSNDPDMALRMAEYALRIYRTFRIFPKQIVLYVGEPKLRMSETFVEPDSVNPDFIFRYALHDFRDLDGAALLDSSHVEDNVLAILTRLQDQAGAVRRILARIASMEKTARRALFTQFLIISGLRRLEQTIKEEAQKMPILNDILGHEVIGPAILQGRQEGLEEGLQEGRREGRQEGRQEILRRLLEKRFGPISKSVEARLASLSASELDAVAVRLLDAKRLEELFPET
jgi:predicted transposase YdaD